MSGEGWLPTYVQVAALGCLQLTTVIASLGMWMNAKDSDSRSVYIGCSCFTSCFLQPFVHVWMEPNNLRARLNLFVCDFANWVIWFFVCHLIILDLKGAGTILPNKEVKDILLDWIGVCYLVFLSSMYILLRPVWNFYIEKRNEDQALCNLLGEKKKKKQD